MNYSTYFENKKRYESTLSPKDFEDMRISEQKAVTGTISIFSEIAKKGLGVVQLPYQIDADYKKIKKDISDYGTVQSSTIATTIADLSLAVALAPTPLSVGFAVAGIFLTLHSWNLNREEKRRRDNFNKFYQYLNTKEAQDYMKCPYCLDIRISNPTVYETEGVAKFTITLDKELKDDLRLDLFTVEGTATEDKDYGGVKKYTSSITIPAGQTTYEYTVQIAKDGKYEGSENFLLVAEPTYFGLDVLSQNLPKYISALGTILDFPQEECPTTPKPKKPYIS